jgi:hypothetical protein
MHAYANLMQPAGMYSGGYANPAVQSEPSYASTGMMPPTSIGSIGASVLIILVAAVALSYVATRTRQY